MSKFYVLHEPTTSDAFIVTDDNSVPQGYATEAEAIEAAKEYSGESIVLKVTAKVAEVTKYKVTKVA
jgi:hypothetical protein